MPVKEPRTEQGGMFDEQKGQNLNIKSGAQGAKGKVVEREGG